MGDYTKRVIEAMNQLQKMDYNTFYQALAIYEIIGDVEPTDEQVEKVSSFLNKFLKNNSMYDEYVREKIEDIFYPSDDEDEDYEEDDEDEE